MDYYEELGLSRAASTEEIRRAYKALARLLHPDPQGAEELKPLAECQMKRLNAICAVLTDSAQRRKYDLSLQAQDEEPAGSPRRPARLRHWLGFSPSDARIAAWLSAVTVLAGGVFWYLTRDSGRAAPAYQRPPQVQESPAEVKPPAALPSPIAQEMLAREVSQLRRALEIVTAERDAARAQAMALRSRDPAGVLAPAPPLAADSLPAPPLIPAPEVSPPRPAAEPASLPRSSPASRFAGTWVYAPPKVAPTSTALYPPEYIEAVIVEEGGLLRGRYYGRYRVADRPISPEVVFQFEGRAGRDAAVLEWTGGHGAKGEVRLALLSPSSMRVSWTATELGSSPGLASGTAVLVRRAE